MINEDAYAALYRKDMWSRNTLRFFEDKAELHHFISKLHHETTETNQRFSCFSYVFGKGAPYPTDYEAFQEEKRNLERKSYHIGIGYYVQRTFKSGKVIGKTYNFQEDFLWQIPEWKEKGCKDIVILDLDEAVSGDYYYKREIEHVWGKKKEPLLV